MRVALLLSLAALLLTFAPAVAAPPAFSADDLTFFEKQVRPLLQEHCLKCHGGDKTRGGLRLTSRDEALRGGDQGPAVSLEQPDRSLLLHAINYRNGLEMPPKGKLPPEQIAILTRWVQRGLPWTPVKVAVEPRHAPKGGVITEEAKKYWAYQPVRRPTPPTVRHAGEVRNPIDAFLLAALEAKGLEPVGPAERLDLLRRVTYDLTGLPPTPEEADAFLADTAPGAYERLLDRLLESSHYGEKWGRHWLDLVRFAETNGYERDGPKPFAWRFRDYVIRSFNADKPYDRFLREQLAGDELYPGDPDAIIATGFYRLGLWDDEPVDPKQARFDELDDYVATVGQAFLATSLNCARCHEHKRDPILQADYYRLLAFFQDVPRYSDSRNVRSSANLTDISPPERRAVYEADLRKREARKAELKVAMERIEDVVIKRMSAEDQRAAEGIDRPQVVKKLKDFAKTEEWTPYTVLKTEIELLQKVPDPPGRELALSVNNCLARPAQTHVLIRGSAQAEGAKVSPGFPTVLGFPDPVIPVAASGARTAGRRRVLADWITAPDNPLTARAFVNRLWQHHFGRGIVPTPNDFGLLGELPSHPQLLDWLAAEFVAGGWKVKRMHKLILTSSAYRRSARSDEAGLRVDPANVLLWRFTPRRLAAEEVRDSILAVSGRLSRTAGGPSVYPPIPREVLAGQSRPGEGWGKATPEEATRRSVYVYVKRSLLVPILSQHDQADTDATCPVRYTTTVPTQALGMLNGDFAREQAAALAERLRREAPGGVREQVRRTIRLTTCRRPSDAEVRQDVAFVEKLRAEHGLGEEAALRQYCLLALNANEFFYLD